MEKTLTGLVIKGIGGFYYVEAANVLYECKAKGIFRRQKISPLPGDRVTVQLDSGGGYPCLSEIHPRKNSLIRPALANLDRLFLVLSITKPSPSTLVTDRMTAIARYKGIEPVIVVNKCDLMPEQAEELATLYRHAGFPVVQTSTQTGEGIEELRPLLAGKISAFTGNSGVGKSSIMNLLDSRLALSTGEISDKLGRGRHTTRHVELFQLEGGGYLADTPGFSALDLERCERIPKDQLAHCFGEFEDHLEHCRFSSCTHTCDKGCGVLAALEEGLIEPTRHESYCVMYDEAKQWKEYEWKTQ